MDKKYFSLLLFIFISLNVYTQETNEKIDTIKEKYSEHGFYNTKEDVRLITKLAFFHDSDYPKRLNEKEFQKFDAIVIDTFEMSSDKDMVFLKIYQAPNSQFSKEKNSQYYFVLAIDFFTGEFFRLKGFNGNDFTAFCRRISNYMLSFEFGAPRIFKKKDLQFFYKPKLMFINFDCLFESMKKNDFDISKYPCLTPGLPVVVVSSNDNCNRWGKPKKKKKKKEIKW